MSSATFRVGGVCFSGRTRIMGILNLTPDSFYEPSRAGADDAAARALAMEREGAEIIDIGGQSTRPGYRPADPEEEISRVLPALKKMKTILKVPVSVDTFYPEVAEAALAAGADMINDVSCLAREGMADIIARRGASVCIMHDRRGNMQPDLMTDKLTGLSEAVRRALDAGIDPERIILDGGIGFNKSAAEDRYLLENYARLKILGYPLLLGASRKSMFGGDAHDRLPATLRSTAFASKIGIDFVRVHDVAENSAILKGEK